MNLPAFLRTSPPGVALEIDQRRVVAVALSGAPGAPAQVTGWAVEPLPDGVVVPSLTAANVARPAELSGAIERAWGRVGQRPRRIGLVLPDAVGKVSIVRFQDVPAKTSDLDELVKFQMRKGAPFRVEDSQFSYVPGASSADGQEFIVVQARREIVSEYERVCADTGALAGVVDLATFGVAHCVRATGGAIRGDWLLIHVTADGASLAIFRGEDLVFFRHRGGEADGHLGELVHQTAMYYQDRLGGLGLCAVVVGGASAAALNTDPWREIQARLGVKAEAVDPASILSEAARAPWSELTSEAAVPALGLALALRADA